jgi:hypothetical protein
MGRSSLEDLSEGLGAVQANLIVHARCFGVSFAGTSWLTGCDTSGVTNFVAWSFLPPHAKVMHRFLGTTGVAGSTFGDTLMLFTTAGTLLETIVAGGAEGVAGMGDCIDFLESEKGPRLVNNPFGGGGLGVLVREGLVSPSLVSSAVDAKLVLLIIDRRRDKSVLTCMSGFEVVSSGLFNAIVSRDSFRSDRARTADF